MNKNLNLFNTLSKKKEKFIPINNNKIGMYVCGPTVYDYAHIGNARMAVVNDLLVRFLKLLYPKVTYVSNITDIDDKIIEAAQTANTPMQELTLKFEAIYNERNLTKAGKILGITQPAVSNALSRLRVIFEDQLFKRTSKGIWNK